MNYEAVVHLRITLEPYIKAKQHYTVRLSSTLEPYIMTKQHYTVRLSSTLEPYIMTKQHYTVRLSSTRLHFITSYLNITSTHISLIYLLLDLTAWLSLRKQAYVYFPNSLHSKHHI